MTTSTHPIDLTKPLPSAIREPKTGFWTSYRSFAVFSRPWCLRRTCWVLFWIATISASVAIAKKIGGDVDPAPLTPSLVIFSIDLFALACFGPIAATVTRVRREGKPGARKHVLLALASGMLCGVTLVFFAHDAERKWLESAAQVAKPEATAADMANEKNSAHDLEDRWHKVPDNLLFALLIGGGLAGIAYIREGHSIDSIRRERDIAEAQSQKQESDAKLAILQAQVEPHFLFNSLASVRALVKQEPDRAQATIDALVTFLRASIPQMRAEQGVEVISTVKQQVDLAKAFLDVMAVRMGDRLAVKVDVPEILYEHPFPPLLLISLAENAIKHGAEAKAGTTNITIRAKATAARQLMVSVIDTGIGMQPVATSGVGLANIRAQLSTRFGDAAELQLSQNNTGEGGVVASIVIPLHHT